MTETFKQKLCRLVAFAITALLFSAVQCVAGSPQDITNIIRYTPPTDFWGGAARGTRSDPGDNPLSLDGPELLHYAYPNRGDVIFKIGLAGAYLGKGKIVKFLSTEPSDLQKYMEAEYKGRFPLVTVTPAVIGTVDGLIAVSMDGTRPPGPVKPTFLHFCWVQIDTNIVLKITAVANSAKDFQQETNSLKLLKIDKTQLLGLITSEQKKARTTETVSDTCMDNLRIIAAAKQQWGIEHHQAPDSIPTWSDIIRFLGHAPGGQMPHCPNGGVYTIGRLDENPTCSIGGKNHTLPAAK